MCYLDVAVRGQYVSESKFARRGLGSQGAKMPAGNPTAAEPGTDEKISVLAERVAANQSLWHPEDKVIVSGAAYQTKKPRKNHYSKVLEDSDA